MAFSNSYIRFAASSKKRRKIAAFHLVLVLKLGTFPLLDCDRTVIKALRKTT